MGFWVFHRKSDDEFIGRGGLKVYEIDGNEVIGLAYAVMSGFWNRGFATEVAAASLDVGFGQLGFSEIGSWTLPVNRASQRVMEKLGFEYERDFEFAGLPHRFYRLATGDWKAYHGTNQGEDVDWRKAMTKLNCWTVVLVGILVFPILAAGADPTKEAYEKGVACYAKRDFDAALVAFSEAIRLNPEYAEAFSNRGGVYGTKGNYNRAIIDCTEAIRLNPKLAGAYCNRSVAYRDRGNLDKAIADCTEAIRLDPRSAEAYCERGSAYGSKGNYEKAIADFTEAVRLSPKLAEPYWGRGSAYRRKGNLNKAIADLTEAIQLDPRLPQVYYRRGIAYGEKGDYERAIADHTEAIRLNPKLAEAYSNRGWAYGGKGDYEETIKNFTEAIRLNPRLTEAYLHRGCAYGYRSNYDKAIADLTEAIRLNPKCAVAYCDRGSSHFNQGRLREGCRGLHRGRSAHSVPSGAALAAGPCLREEGRHKRGHRGL